MQSTWREILLWLIGVLTGALLVTFGRWMGRQEVAERDQTSSPTFQPVAVPKIERQPEPLPSLPSPIDFWVPIVEKVGKAVVTVESEEALPGGQNAGSGVIFDGKRGLIVTNYHVTEGARNLIVTLKDGRRFRGKSAGCRTPCGHRCPTNPRY